MLLVSFFSWWYGPGWLQLFRNMPVRIKEVGDSFSVGQLLKTLFAPWRRIMTYPGASLQDKMRAWADNMFSRVVGFVVRLLVLISAMVVVSLVAVLSVLELIIWPLLPLAIPGGIIIGALL